MVNSLAWMADGLCRQVDPALWFPENGDTAREAKRICSVCPVLTPCREYSIADDRLTDGIWGGLSGLSRRQLRDQRPPRTHCKSGRHPWTPGAERCKDCQNEHARKAAA